MKRLVLAGGGHAHVEVLRRFARQRVEGAEVVLVTPEPESPYSGMLPGHVAGFYSREEIFIDVARLASACAARLVHARVAAIRAADREVDLDDGTRLAYDVLSLDIGSTPATGGARGVAAHALSVKPIPAFLDGWAALVSRGDRGALRRVAVVGGGAAGVEMLLAMQYRLAQGGGSPVEWHLLTDAADLLVIHPPPVRRIFDRVLAARGVVVHRSTPVAGVDAGAVLAAGGQRLEADATVWATGAAAAGFLRQSGLRVDAAGFVEVDAFLRSTSHAEVHAAGDVASMARTPRPKSGVYAVRQGPPLERNLRAALTGAPPARYVPQRRSLALISTGDRYAVATRGAFALEGAWVWRWKDWIDRRFMARYRA